MTRTDFSQENTHTHTCSEFCWPLAEHLLAEQPVFRHHFPIQNGDHFWRYLEPHESDPWYTESPCRVVL